MRTSTPPWPGLSGRILAQRIPMRIAVISLVAGAGCLIGFFAAAAAGVPMGLAALVVGPPGGLFTTVGVYQLLRARRFSDVKLDLGQVPLTVDGLRGLQLLLPQGIAAKTVKAKLECRKLTTYMAEAKRTAGSDGGASLAQSALVLFAQERTVPVRPHDSGARARIELGFAVTGSFPPADNALTAKMLKRQVGESYVEWVLEVTADVPGIDLAATFALPLRSS